MAVQDHAAASSPSSGSSLIYDPKFRGIVVQALLAIGLIAFIYWIATNTIENLQRAHIASGFGFLRQPRRLRHLPVADRLRRRNRPTAGPSWSACSTRCWLRSSASCSRRSSGSCSASRGCPRTGSSPASRPSMSRRCATSRCCFSSCSGTGRSCRSCPARARAIALPFNTNLSNRGLIIPGRCSAKGSRQR